MSVSKIKNKKDLLDYLKKHTVVKDSLVSSVIDISKQFYLSPHDLADFIYSNHFFRKPEIVINVLESNSEHELLKQLTQRAIKKKDIALLNKLDKRFPDRENEIIQDLFSENLSLENLFECIVLPNNTSGIRSEAIKHVKRRQLSTKELLLFINSLNFVLSIPASPVLKLLREDFEDDYILTNCVFSTLRPQDKGLLDLRRQLLTEAASSIKLRWEMMILIDLAYHDDLEYLKSNLESKYLHWMRLDLELSASIPYTSSFNFLSWLEVGDKDQWSDFGEIWDEFVTTESSNIFKHFFNVIKIKLILFSDLNLDLGIDFNKILNHPFTAYYVKSLHDLDILNQVPKMDEIVSWPDIDTVKLYLTKFKEYSPWNEESPLSRLGYHVGKTSNLTVDKRRKILSHAFLSASSSQLNSNDWGMKGSPIRLYKIISFLNQRIKIARGYIDKDFNQAINDWSSDLEFLYDKFYEEKYADEFIPTNFDL